ncbi:cystathionine gamma-synthase family protein [Pyrofollis japonicus]|uniref:aminotransferase class I/II-fold pyridoxal phosphate-dependent enzyme n=1 Tax=Pyrofollis japonicus TaxID=3060460 RepID=UPI00295B2836|nr:aminotransferase class I/II-fold pyridoxal phosphate-dependent enzyme [Pyrofollis japonicus]BEP18419.1 cystathionine gamma-synthase family protein [Pyrofollis japonicus]
MFEECIPRHWDDVVPPIHISVIYAYRGERWDPVEEIKYGRENNPTAKLLEETLSCMEGAGYGLVFNTGMASLSAILHELRRHGKKVAMARLVYGSTRQLAERLLGNALFLAGPPWDELLSLADKVDAILVETIANPTLRVPPLSELAKTCSGRDCILIVDNTFASPVIYRPLERGADIVVESLTKYIAGHNDVLGGFIGLSDEKLYRELWEWRKLLGSIIQPLDAYLVLRGLRTLELRVRRSSETALEIARRLEESGLVERVYYPGLESHPDHENAKRLFGSIFGGVLAFDTGSREKALSLLRKIRLIVPAPSLGAVDSIASYPYESSHRGLSSEEKESLGITPGLIRLSVGVDDVEALWSELERVLKTEG